MADTEVRAARGGDELSLRICNESPAKPVKETKKQKADPSNLSRYVSNYACVACAYHFANCTESAKRRDAERRDTEKRRRYMAAYMRERRARLRREGQRWTDTV